MAQVDLFSLPDDPEPRPTPQPAGPPVRLPDSGDLLSQAKGLYGGSWDADAEQNFYNRLRQQTPDELLANTSKEYRERFPSQGAPRGSQPMVPNQFDDAYSNQLEGIAKAQMGQVRSNPGLDKLMGFLDQEFTRLSTNPGFRPEELATINTQMFEPIEQRRQASNTRAVQRAATRGYLPSSGLTYLTDAPQGGEETLDTTYDRMRTQAGRDLSIKAIDQRRADLGQALDLGRMLGLQIPQSQRAEELNLAQLLYNMPRQSLMDLLAVLNGSPSSMDLMSGSVAAQNANLVAQQQQDARNAQLMEQIGAMLGTLFR
jgi:hypothetical protein